MLIAGPNGAGKSTLAPFLLRDALAVSEFVNADRIAQDLSAFKPHTVAIQAGRLMLSMARRDATFAFETTLASRSFVRWLTARRSEGYDIYLVYLWLPNPEGVPSRGRASGAWRPRRSASCRVSTICRRTPQLLQALPADFE